jgi:hypothetical protein
MGRGQTLLYNSTIAYMGNIINPKPKQVYIGSALTHLPSAIFSEYKTLIVGIADMIEDIFQCKVRYALEDSDPFLPKYNIPKRPAECYRMDRELAEQCDLFIAEASFPSTGLGQELQIVAYNNKPAILIYKNYGNNLAEKKDYRTKSGEGHTIELGNKIVSVMVQGNPAIKREILYKNKDECIQQVKEFILEYYGLI